jgi:hypothetical protein
MERVPQHPVEIAPGDKIQVRYGTEAALALVEAVLPPSELRVRVTVALEGEVLLRWIDGTGSAWSVSAIAESADDLVALHLLGEWTQDQMRASQRVSGNRHSLRGDIQAGSLAPGTRLDLVCLDISASGCRASGVGRLPADGDIVRLCCIHRSRRSAG